jgi:hypothetical protein
MKSTFELWTRRIGLVIGAAVAATAVINAIRLASWASVLMVAWLPAVFVAIYSRPSGRCGRRRRTTSAG